MVNRILWCCALACLGACFAWTGPAGAVTGLTIAYKPARASNFTNAHRPGSDIRMVVIHTTESSYGSAISWFENPSARASANYVVSRGGAVTQMVPDSDIAWHAGNWAINRESIGVEHEGYSYIAGSFTDAEYRASARLVGYEMRHYLLPIDRRHVIGHSEVPDPNNPHLFGGFAHHTDPGKHWDWNRYLSYVRAYARGTSPAPSFRRATPAARAKPTVHAEVSAGARPTVTTSLRSGSTVQGFVAWRANVSRPDVSRVDFLVDGRVRFTDRKAPFVFGGGGWDTTRETNGPHVLTLRIVTKKGATAGTSVRVLVENMPFQVAAAQLQNGSTVRGDVHLTAVVDGGNADHVDFLVDGKVVHTESSAPFEFDWNAAGAGGGAHTLALRAVSVDGRVAESSVTVVVPGPAPQPSPKPSPRSRPGLSPVQIDSQSLSDGQTVSGSAHWEASVSGSVSHVDFAVDGRWRWSERSAPYVYGGDGGSWNTAQEQAGQHVLTVTAYGRDGSRATSTVTVTVSGGRPAPPPPTPLSVVFAGLQDGQQVQGDLHWQADAAGSGLAHVDLLVDGRPMHSESSAPYDYEWDTSRAANGSHALTLRAVARGGTSSESTITVVVANQAAVPAIRSQSLSDGQTVSGAVRWSAAVDNADSVSFLVDGDVRATDTWAPYIYRWSTTDVANGKHRLVVRASRGDATTESSVDVDVENQAQVTTPLTVAFSGLADGSTVSGSLAWQATVTGTAAHVDLLVDGRLLHTENTAPYDYTWDTRTAHDGTHELVLHAVARDGTSAETTIHVTVANASIPSPAPAPASTPPTTTPATTSAAPATVTQSIADGSTLTGTVTWSVDVEGGTARRVEFLVDGRRRGTAWSAPFAATWDTTRERDGQHQVGVRVTLSDRSVVTASATVTIANH